MVRKKKKEERRKRSNIIDKNQKHRNVSNGGSNRSMVRSVPTSILPPLCWSSLSLMCHINK